MDSLYDTIKSYLSFSIENPNGLNYNEIQNSIPKGWSEIIQLYLQSVTALDGKVVRLYIDKGVLRSVFESSGAHDKVIGWLSQYLAKVSSTVCMVNGTSGARRKHLDGWPCLSSSALLIYSNELADRGEI